MSSTESDSLREKIIAFEESLNDVLLAEYSKRRRFVDSALEDYLKNHADVEELQKDRVKNYADLHNLSLKFLFSSLILLVIILAFDIGSAAIIVGYLLLIFILSKKYVDIKHNDAMQLGNLVLCQMEIQRIQRDLNMYGVSEADVIRFKVDRDLIKYSHENAVNKNDDEVSTQRQRIYSLELRIAFQVCEGMRSPP